jgi:hypothetical protein
VVELEDLLSKRSVVATHPGPVQVAGHTYNTGDVITTDQLEALWTATTTQNVDAVAASKVYQSAWSLVKESGCTAQGVKLETDDYATTVGGAHGAHNRYVCVLRATCCVPLLCHMTSQISGAALVAPCSCDDGRVHVHVR